VDRVGTIAAIFNAILASVEEVRKIGARGVRIDQLRISANLAVPVPSVWKIDVLLDPGVAAVAAADRSRR